MRCRTAGGYQRTHAGTGRQPYAARAFFLKYADRILFGADLLPEVEMYRLYYRFLETADEYFEFPLMLAAGRWNIYGIFLPDDVLRKSTGKMR